MTCCSDKCPKCGEMLSPSGRVDRDLRTVYEQCGVCGWTDMPADEKLDADGFMMTDKPERQPCEHPDECSGQYPTNRCPPGADADCTVPREPCPHGTENVNGVAICDGTFATGCPPDADEYCPDCAREPCETCGGTKKVLTPTISYRDGRAVAGKDVEAICPDCTVPVPDGSCTDIRPANTVKPVPRRGREGGEVMAEPTNDEQRSLFDAVDEFAEAMKKKLAKKERDGWEGWNCAKNEIGLKESLLRHLSRRCSCGSWVPRRGLFEPSNLVDIANFCMFLWTIAKERIATVEAEKEGE